ncbi:MAG: 4-(cytidine 5'-diphospho)-2-C-methyl-D-erythritol kinase [Gammaproteobacteria bacterium]|nr:4-(cytidine 5'-diphospho)-2-C-methyl-D-erythritol kinase [Gammaproteobacteria bacterium]
MNSPHIWPAPAKLNLFLHVTGRRADGYHLLQTVFQFIDWQDDLEFTVTHDGVIDRAQDVAGVDGAQDLTVRAARLLQQTAGVSRGVRIRLTKRLPIGGGIGGGSSDAATTLLALNHLWGVHMPRQQLARLGLALGADVPVFVSGHAAWAEGVGEELAPIDLPEPWYVVVAPPVTVLTREVFAALDLTGLAPPITIRDFRAGLGRNDLAAIVRRRHPEVDRAWQWLSQYGAVRMTGSGACVFLEVADPEQGRQIVAECPPGHRCALARGLNRHPVHAYLG